MAKLLLVLMSLVFMGCATILNDDYQKINVTTSNNKEVKGQIEGVPFTAPGIVSVKRSKADKVMTVDSSSCAKQVLLNSNVDNKFFINILTGGTLGSSTDYGTEKMWKFQDTVSIQCQ
jgi:hypothetical protein